MAETLSSAGVIDAAQDYVRLSLAGMGGVSIQVQGTFSGTITFEGTVQGQAFTAFLVTPIGSTTAVTTTTGTGIWTGSAVGLTSIQARMSSYSSGAATVLIRAATAAPGGAGGGGGGGGAVTIADGADVAEGATTDAKVTGDNTGTVSAKLRGLSYLWALVVDTVGQYVKVNVQNTSIPVSTALISAPLCGQTKIAVTGTAVQLGSNVLTNGVIITAKTGNAANITVGQSGVTNTVDGTGNGYILAAGASVSFGVSNTNALYINGTANDIVSFAGS